MKMNNVILSHLQYSADFRNLLTITGSSFKENFLTQKEGQLIFFGELVFDGDVRSQGISIGGKNEGLRIYCLGSGRKYSEGHYENGKEEGLFIYWDIGTEDGQEEVKSAEKNYHQGKFRESQQFGSEV